MGDHDYESSDEEEEPAIPIVDHSTIDLSFLRRSAPWKTGVMPYELIFAWKLTGKKENLINTRKIVRVENYYPYRPLTSTAIRNKVGYDVIFKLYLLVNNYFVQRCVDNVSNDVVALR